MIQANIKGFVTRMRYRRDRQFRREYAARKIQARFRAYIQRKKYLSKNMFSKVFRNQARFHEMPSKCTDKISTPRIFEAKI